MVDTTEVRKLKVQELSLEDYCSGIYMRQGKVLPYSLPSVRLGDDPGVQAVSSQVTKSHPPMVGCHYFPPGLRFTFVSVHQMAPPLTEVTDI